MLMQAALVKNSNARVITERVNGSPAMMSADQERGSLSETMSVDVYRGVSVMICSIQHSGRVKTAVGLIKTTIKAALNGGKIPLDLSLCYGKDFKSYELAKLLKLVPANRNL